MRRLTFDLACTRTRLRQRRLSTLDLDCDLRFGCGYDRYYPDLHGYPAYDQYGDTVTASSPGTFSSTSTLPGGASCTVATPSICTTEAAHGLAVDDDLVITSLGAFTCSTRNASASGTALVVNTADAGCDTHDRFWRDG